MTTISFTVYGTPVPQGSMRNVARRGQHARLISDNPKLAAWRKAVRDSAAIATRQFIPSLDEWDAPVRMRCEFYFARPKSDPHRVHMMFRPDGDKLLRAVFDACTGVLYKDDAQVVSATYVKRYDREPRAFIVVWYGDQVYD